MLPLTGALEEMLTTKLTAVPEVLRSSHQRSQLDVLMGGGLMKRCRESYWSATAAAASYPDVAFRAIALCSAMNLQAG